MTRCLLALAALLLASAASAQSNDEVRRVVLANGDVYVGVVADESADPVVVTTRDGIERRFQRDQVEMIAPLIRGRFFRTDPLGTSLAIGPTARTQGGGRTRVGLTGFVPTVNVGLSDRVDLTGAGTFIIGDGSGFVPLIGVKGAVVERPGLTLALGASVAATLGGEDTFFVCGDEGCVERREDGDAFLAVPYGVATVGDATRAFTVGVAGFVGSVNQDVEVADGAAVWVGGEVQLNNGVKLFGEAITLVGQGDTGVVFLPGVRLFGDSFAFDVIGVLALYDDDGGGLGAAGFAPLPFRVSYTF